MHVNGDSYFFVTFGRIGLSTMFSKQPGANPTITSYNASRVTRLDEFLPTCLLGAAFLITKVVYILDYFFPRLRLYNNFNDKWVGLHFGRFFHKLIWSSVAQHIALGIF
jgi:hypothetical protein